MKKCFLMIGVYLLSITMTQAAFIDVTDSHEFVEAINYAQENGIVSGYGDGTFKPDKVLNRAEFTKIIIATQFKADSIDNCQYDGSFSDVDVKDWFVDYICLAKKKWVIKWYENGKFKPEMEINFAEAAKIIVSTFFDSSELEGKVEENDPWYKLYIKELGEKGAIPMSIMHFEKKMTRGELVEIIWRLQEWIEDKESQSFNSIVKWYSKLYNFINQRAQYYHTGHGRSRIGFVDERLWLDGYERTFYMLNWIQELDLTGLELESIPREIWLLSNLEVLDIAKNNLRALPKEIWQLRKLKKILVSFNQLESLPEEINQSGSLWQLDIKWNDELIFLPEEAFRLAGGSRKGYSILDEKKEMPLQIIELFYNNLKYQQLKKAYRLSSQNVDYSTFEEWYEDVTDVVLENIEKIGEGEYSYLVSLHEGNKVLKYQVQTKANEKRILESKSEKIIEEWTIVGNYNFGIEITSPEDGTLINESDIPYKIKGISGSNCQKIEVFFKNPDADIDENYTLQLYKPGDTEFFYKLNPEWGNIGTGRNEYTFKATCDGGEFTETINLYFYEGEFVEMGKPVVYLYPEEKTKVKVSPQPENGITIVEPDLLEDGSWEVEAYPDGKIVNLADQTVWPYLFWEGYADLEIPQTGFLVKHSELESFFEEKLYKLGLNKKEISDFKEYWLTVLSQKDKYYFITFVKQESLDKHAPLLIEPKPQTLIRIYFDYQVFDESVKYVEQTLPERPVRTGFTVTEWGGSLK